MAGESNQRTAAATSYNEKLPALPGDDTPPPLPLKSSAVAVTLDKLHLPPIPAISSIAPVKPPSSVTPVASVPGGLAGSSSFSPVEKPKKPTPLSDLVESEEVYVEFLTGVIRNVAAAWSRSNLPPPELDLMFRSMEGVFRANRTLLAKLMEIGDNPSSPKALGDLLMRWIDDLDKPYTDYSQTYCSGFDCWQPVKLNSKLGGILRDFSASCPPPATIAQTSQLLDPSVWTLDALFLLPKGRLSYYRKLYGRLLRSTAPGRSDYRLLTAAMEKLDSLLITLDGRAHIKVSHSSASLSEESFEVSVKSQERRASGTTPEVDGTPLSGRSSHGPGNTLSSQEYSSPASERFSSEVERPSIDHGSVQSVAQLERRLTTNKTLDIFTMGLKQVRLQLAPPSLPYTRELRASVSVVIRFTPKSTGVEVVHHHGHLFILSDLFLICEGIPPEEREAGGPDMRLCYPPLSGKVLKVSPVLEPANALNISIMRKEFLIVEAESKQARNQIIKEFEECISFARAISGAAREPVPPLPAMSELHRLSPAHKLHDSFSKEEPDQNGIIQQPEGQPLIENVAKSISPPPSGPNSEQSSIASIGEITSAAGGYSGSSRNSQTSVRSSASSGRASTDSYAAPGMRRVPSLQNSHQGPMYPVRQSPISPTVSPPSSFPPGQIVPPARSTSMFTPHPMRPMRPMQPMSPPPQGGGTYPGPPGRVNSPPSQNAFGHPQPVSTQALRHRPSVHSLHQRPSPQYVVSTAGPLQHPPHPLPGQVFPSLPSGPPSVMLPPRPPSEPPMSQRLHKSLSSRSLVTPWEDGQATVPPIPPFPSAPAGPQRPYPAGAMGPPPPSRPILPSQIRSRASSMTRASMDDQSPPISPVDSRPQEHMRSLVSMQTKCKVFHQQHHAQWKSLGSARLTLYRQEPTNVKQLVVEDKKVLISTIVLTDGVERVGKTGVAIELSDSKGGRTGIIYMIQLRNEKEAGQLFESLLAGSDRSK